ncbi:hypothetical protein RHGRI_016688 [Rhododendron griersonianum]|uniref:RNase H type-1 domain-containing protein n=1 Tax=Rhododendron griersonianum TaxID=479676 RepID=A0AAV6JV30_9ERIC|nr:hypothetical protein RHGRI_016688 [Rhododendron griersonianum]
MSKALQIPPDHARLIVDTIAVVHYSDCDIEAGGGVDVCFLILFLYVQSYKRLLPRTHKDSAAMADMWPSTSSFELDFCPSSGGNVKAAVVMRDWKGSLLEGAVVNCAVSSPLQGELIAIILACGMAMDLKLFGVMVESDCH